MLCYCLSLVLALLGWCSGALSNTCGLRYQTTDDGIIDSYNVTQTSTIDILQDIGPLQCEKQCRLHTDCRSTIYSRQRLTCVLRTTEHAEDDSNTSRAESIQINLGSCNGHTCGKFERCISLKSGKAYCLGFGVKEGDVKLVNGTAEQEGRVEIYHNGRWGTMCADDHWHTTEARTVCRLLGYSYGVPIPNAYFGKGVGQIWFDNVQCGEDLILTNCVRSVWTSQSSCTHADDAGVVCSNDTFSDEKAPVRLTGGITDSDGRVEIFYAGHWGTLCGRLYITEANVICRQLGYSGGTPSALPSTQNDLIWRDNPVCTEGTAYLSNCSFNADWGNSVCADRNRSAVICLANVTEPQNTTSAVLVRLQNGNTSHEGRVEVYHAGYWGTICNSHTWSNTEARVVCRQLNFTGGYAVSQLVFGKSGIELPVWLSKLTCVGDEENLAQCQLGKWGEHITPCDQDVPAGVICKGPQEDGNSPQEGTIRLMDGPTITEGRVEVFIHGYWSAVCRQYWNDRPVGVICRQLGYQGGSAILDQRYGSGNGYILVEVPQCDGSEDQLLDCKHTFYQYCKSRMDAGAVCIGNESNHDVLEGSVRLADSSDNTTSGRVEIYRAGHWGSVCERKTWTDETAAVVCRQLGQSGGRALHHAFYGKGLDPIWMDGVVCVGNETKLVDCSYATTGMCVHLAHRHTKDISVVCGSNGSNTVDGQVTYGDIRLVDGNNGSQGRVEIYGRTGYGTVCGALIDQNVAIVVCRQLGYDPANARILPSGDVVIGEGEIWISNIVCKGTEQRLDHCDFRIWGFPNACGHDLDVGVACGN